MLPRELSDNLCSLRPNEKRPALVCQVGIMEDGALTDEDPLLLSMGRIKSKTSL